MAQHSETQHLDGSPAPRPRLRQPLGARNSAAARPLKIVLYGINFSPELTGIGKYTGEMAEYLASNNCEVRVVSAPPYYPEWQVGPGYKKHGYSVEQLAGSRVYRCPLYVPAKPTGTKRVLHLLSFAITSLPVVLRLAFWRPDVVWMAAPAFACAPGALLAAKLSGAAAYLHIQDYEVDVAFNTGLLKGRLIKRLVSATEKWLMRRFDRVSSISDAMVERARQKGVDEHRVIKFPNWVDVGVFAKPKAHLDFRKQLGIEPDAVVALFSGTLGAKQGLRMIPEAARILEKQCPSLVFVVCGDGVMKFEMEAAQRHLSNFYTLPLQPSELVPSLLHSADIHLLTQDAGVSDLVMPSKLGAMLASGRPVVCTTDKNTELGSFVCRAGEVCAPGDVAQFAAAIAKLVALPKLRGELGAEAKRIALDQFSAELVLKRFHDEIAGNAAYSNGSRFDASSTSPP